YLVLYFIYGGRPALVSKQVTRHPDWPQPTTVEDYVRRKLKALNAYESNLAYV
ncbi:Hypothetical predicted protein, partial [Paramuricea clavata]